ncbi:MAG: DAK2 domain-containing protein, partial [Clostridiales bacterium]|nr:DAK2 domain-containing protein [Clostridiales bacterium]
MIQHKTIDGLLLRDMVVAGAALLEKNREAVDALNVFPVPDGDTGTNMSLTMQSATREVNAQEYLRADEAAAAISKGALKGARGNSGVITSQLLRGFATSLKGVEKITPVQFARALKAGSDKAYKAVMKPKEGTILTVARVIAEDAIKYTESNPDDYDGLMNVILTSGEAILKRTPDMLPPLKAAGVVDSGGRGLMLIYTGYAAVMRGEEIADPAALLAGDSQVEEDIHDLSGDLPYAYCTEYDIVNFREDCTEGDVDSFRRRLNRIGNCVKVTGDLTEEGDRTTMEKVKSCLDLLKVPYHVVLGNHETKWSDSGCTAFGEIFGGERFEFEHKGFLFLGFNSGPLMRMAYGHVVPQDIRWMTEEMDKNGKDKPVILVTHYPLMEGDVDNWYEVTDAVRPYNVRLFIGGHYHSN